MFLKFVTMFNKIWLDCFDYLTMFITYLSIFILTWGWSSYYKGEKCSDF